MEERKAGKKGNFSIIVGSVVHKPLGLTSRGEAIRQALAEDLKAGGARVDLLENTSDRGAVSVSFR